MNLILKLILGILVGIAVGYVAPDFIIRFVVTFKELFGEFIIFVVPLIILLFITSGIACLNGNAGRTLGTTVGIAYSSTVLAALMAAGVALLLLPQLVGGQVSVAGSMDPLYTPFFVITMPPVMDIMTALILAFTFGIGLSMTKYGELTQVVDQGKNIIELLIKKIIIPILPFYIGCVFVQVTAEGQMFSVMKTFVLVLGLVVVLHFCWLLVLYMVAGLVSGRNPFTALKTMLPAYMTALGTMSSVATIPVTLRQTKRNHVSEEIADYCIPLCATIHICGSAITITVCTITVMYLLTTAVPVMATLLPFIFMLGIVMVAAPGVPGGAVMASLALLTSMLGFDSNEIALMIALYLAQDSFGTACNVTGDGAVAMILQKISGKS
jgi:Na+/H+-dicarboxylate symporter